MDTSTAEPVHTPIEGQEIKLPLHFQAFSAMMAFFPAPMASLKPHLPDRRLKLVPVIPGFGVVGIGCLEYEQCDLGPYNEVGIFFPVRHQPALNLPLIPLLFEESFSDMGAYVYRLPVTTQAALDAGLKFWGYPKTLAEIQLDENSGRKICRWLEDDQLVLELSTPLVQPGAERKRTLRTFSVLSGQLLTTAFEIEGSLQSMRRPNAARLTLGSHPYAEEMRAWKMRSWPIETRLFTQMKGRLDAAHQTEPVLSP